MIDCTRFAELHRESLDGPLEGASRADFDAHLEACPACVASLRGYVGTQTALNDLGPSESAEDAPPLPEALVAKILAARREDAGARRRRGHGTA